MGNKTSRESSSNRTNTRNDNDIFISTDENDDYPDDTETDQEKLSYWQMAKLGYQQLVNAIIRPPRCNYSIDNLGPKKFNLAGKHFERKDFELINLRGHVL